MAPIRLRAAASARNRVALRPSPFARAATSLPPSRHVALPGWILVNIFVRAAENELGRGDGKGRKIHLAEIEVRHLKKIMQRIGIRKKDESTALEALARRAVFAIDVGDVREERLDEIVWRCELASFPFWRIAKWQIVVPVLEGGETILGCRMLEDMCFLAGADCVRVKIDADSAKASTELRREFERVIGWLEGLGLGVGAVLTRGEGLKPMDVVESTNRAAKLLVRDDEGSRAFVVCLSRDRRPATPLEDRVSALATATEHWLQQQALRE